jgi:hypothetical protein
MIFPQVRVHLVDLMVIVLRANGRTGLHPAGALPAPKVAIGRAFWRRMVYKTGKGGPQLLAAWTQERAEV